MYSYYQSPGNQLPFVCQFVSIPAFGNHSTLSGGHVHVIEPHHISGEYHGAADPARDHVGMLGNHHIDIWHFIDLARTLDLTGDGHGYPVNAEPDDHEPIVEIAQCERVQLPSQHLLQAEIDGRNLQKGGHPQQGQMRMSHNPASAVDIPVDGTRLLEATLHIERNRQQHTRDGELDFKILHEHAPTAFHGQKDIGHE